MNALQIISQAVQFLSKNSQLFLAISWIPLAVSSILFSIVESFASGQFLVFSLFIALCINMFLYIGFAVIWHKIVFYGTKTIYSRAYKEIFAWHHQHFKYLLAIIILSLIGVFLLQMALNILVVADGFVASILQNITKETEIFMPKWQEFAVIPLILALIFPMARIALLPAWVAIEEKLSLGDLFRLTQPYQGLIFRLCLFLIVIYSGIFMAQFSISYVFNNYIPESITINFLSNFIVQFISYLANGLIITAQTIAYRHFKHHGKN